MQVEFLEYVTILAVGCTLTVFASALQLQLSLENIMNAEGCKVILCKNTHCCYDQKRSSSVAEPNIRVLHISNICTESINTARNIRHTINIYYYYYYYYY